MNDRGAKVCVYMAANAIEGNLIRGLLESDGIAVELRGEHLVAYPGVPRVSETRVYVASHQQQAARVLIEAYERRNAEQRQWRCEGCGESNTAAFEICWQCRSPRPEARDGSPASEG